MEVNDATEEHKENESESLLTYDNPIPLSGPKLANHDANLIVKAFRDGEDDANLLKSPRSLGSPRDLLTAKRRSKSSPRNEDSKFLDVKTTLNAILPPKRTFNGELDSWIQFVSTQVAGRDEVLELENNLEKLLEARQARVTGICPVKEELLSECFDELLRQISLDCPERGLLLMRVRDELRMSIAAYKTVYESSICFSARKALESTESMKELERETEELERQVKALEVEKLEWKNRVKKKEEKVQTERSSRRLRNQEEIKAIENQIASFKEFLDQDKF